jgi:hypothetical protein
MLLVSSRGISLNLQVLVTSISSQAFASTLLSFLRNYSVVVASQSSLLRYKFTFFFLVSW